MKDMRKTTKLVKGTKYTKNNEGIIYMQIESKIQPNDVLKKVTDF